MNLILVRHAHAAPATGGVADSDRELSPTGRTQAGRTGHFLAGLGLEGITIVSSPKRRSLQTAEILAASLGIEGRPRKHECLAGGLDPPSIMKGLAELRKETLIAVSHEPDTGRLLARLLEPSWQGAIPFQPGGFAWLTADRLPPAGEVRLCFFGNPACLGRT